MEGISLVESADPRCLKCMRQEDDAFRVFVFALADVADCGGGGREGERERDWKVWDQMRLPSKVWRSWKKRKRRVKERGRRVSGDDVEDIASASGRGRRRYGGSKGDDSK